MNQTPHIQSPSGNYFMKRPVLTLCVAGIFAALAGLAITRIQPDASLKSMLAEDSPSSQALIHVMDNYNEVNELIMLVDDKSNSKKTQSNLANFAKRLESNWKNHPSAKSLISNIRYQQDQIWEDYIQHVIVPNALFYLNDEQFTELQEKLTPQAIASQIKRNEAMIATPGPAAAALSKQILRDPLRLFEIIRKSAGPLPPGFNIQNKSSLLLSKDQKALLIRLTPTKPASDFDYNRQLLKTVNQLVTASNPGQLNISFTGAHAIAAYSEKNIRGDMVTSINGSMILLGIIFLLIYRSIFSYALVLLPVAIGILCSFGIYTLISTKLSPVAGAAGATLAGLGVDYCIHYLTWYENRRSENQPPLQAANFSKSFILTLLAVCITSATGFAAIAASSVPAIASFGLLGAIGMALVLIATITILPALLGLIDRRGTNSKRTMRNILKPLAPWVAKHPALCLTFMLLIFIAATSTLLTGNHPGFNGNPKLMQPFPNPPLQAQQDIHDRFESETPSTMALVSSNTPQDLITKAHAIRNITHSQHPDKIVSTIGLSTLLPDPTQIPHRIKRNAQLNPSNTIAAFQSAIKQSIFSLDAYKDYTNFLSKFLAPQSPPDLSTLHQYPALANMFLAKPSPSQTPSAVSLIFINQNRADRIAWIDTLSNVQTSLNPIGGVTIADTTLVSSEVQHTIKKDLVRLLAIAGGFVLLCLTIKFRNPIYILLSLIPALFGLVTLFAAMYLLGIDINLINLVGLPLVVGLGVDDGIFLVSHAANAKKEPQQMSINHLATTLQAIFITSLTTIMAFGSLALTSTPAICSLGIVVAIGMTACYLSSTFLLMPLLLIIQKQQPQHNQSLHA